jgi:alpha-amylase
MKTVCLFFQIHQPFRHRRYRFFDIGNDHYYYDDYTNESIMRKIAQKSYLPTNKLLLKLATRLKDKFKVSFSISGLALEQFEPLRTRSNRIVSKSGKNRLC